jgi:hypothetical protein
LLAETQGAAIIRQEAQARKEGARVNANDRINVRRLECKMLLRMTHSNLFCNKFSPCYCEALKWLAIFLLLLLLCLILLEVSIAQLYNPNIIIIVIVIVII